MQILPNIDINIASGNSLLSNCQFAVGARPRVVDASGDTTKHVQMNVDMLARLKTLTEAYKGERDKKEKDRIRRELRTLKMQTFGNDDAYGETLEWPLEFPETIDAAGCFMGFDIVIGNPPYMGTSQQSTNPVIAASRAAIIARGQYSTLHKNWDLYMPFMELGIRLLKDYGAFSMIVPYPVTNQAYAQKTRSMFLNECDMTEIVDLHEKKIFDVPTVSNCIIFASKVDSSNSCSISYMDDKNNIFIGFIQPYDRLIQDTKSLVWNLTQHNRSSKKHSEMKVIGDYFFISQGLQLQSNEKTAKGLFKKDDLLSETQDAIHSKPYIQGMDIDKYTVKRIRYLEWGTERCPGMIRRPTFPELYSNPKILVITLGELKAFLDDDAKYYCNDNLRVLVPWHFLKNVSNKSIDASVKKFSKLPRQDMEDFSKGINIKYVVGILNSMYAAKLLTDIRGDGLNIYTEHLRQIPVAPATPEQQAEIAALVDEILTAKEADPNADISAQMAAIDEKVYALYGVTPKQADETDKRN